MAPSNTIPNVELPPLVDVALLLMRAAQPQPLHGACGWTWTSADCDARLAVDAWLIANGHSLAKHPGTREQRFVCLVDMEYANGPTTPAKPSLRAKYPLPPGGVRKDFGRGYRAHVQLEPRDGEMVVACTVTCGKRFASLACAYGENVLHDVHGGDWQAHAPTIERIHDWASDYGY